MSDTKLELTESELQAKIKAAVEESTAGLARKNSELLTELKEARKGKQYNADDVAKLEETIESLQGELSKVGKEHKAALKQAETLAKQAESAEGTIKNLLVDNGLNDSLTKAGVTDPFYLKAAKALLSSQIKLEQDGENRVAKFGDKPLADAITEWAASDEGKRFVAAQANSGGGAAGSGSNGGAGAAKGKLDGDMKERAAHFASKFDFSAI